MLTKIITIFGRKNMKFKFLLVFIAIFATNNITAQQKYEYVDLGLESKTLWAVCNVGAENPWELGNYFAWGETATKPDYSWLNYKYADGACDKMTKYCTSANHGSNNFFDNRTQLEISDDAAAVKLGGNWRMPTENEFKELQNSCTWLWTENYEQTGVSGYIIKSKSNDNTIFLPACGFRSNDSLLKEASGWYWTSTLYADYANDARGFYFRSDTTYMHGHYRFQGFTIRAVCTKK